VATKDRNGYDLRSGPRDRSLRVGDREREAVAELLRQHHVEGRLDADEFQERLERCLAAKTYGDLDRLIADFPRPEAEPVGRGRAWPMSRVAPLPLIPLLVLAAIVFSGGHLVWLAFPLAFFFLRGLGWRSWGPRYGYGVWGCGPRSSIRAEPRA
jgi:hypothetical protein